MQDIREFLCDLYHAAVDAAHPRTRLEPLLPPERDGKAIVIGAGKAAAAMALEFEKAWRGPVSGLVVTRYGHGEVCRRVKVVEAAHPVPDSAGQDAATAMLKLVEGLTTQDKVFILMSGGGSSLLSLPAPGITLQEKKQINSALLKSGAPIQEINCVRKHLSAIKGGRLALRCQPAETFTYAISDVPGDDPSVIASGPTVADATTSAQALQILERYSVTISESVRRWLESEDSETPKPGCLDASRHHFRLIATPKQSLDAAAQLASSRGITPLVLGDRIEGESSEVAKVMAGIAQYILVHDQPLKKPCVILSGGETTVTVGGTGRGGRNTEFLLSLAAQLKGVKGVYALAADTDGIDGSEHNAGAVLMPGTPARAEERNLSLQSYIANNDSFSFFEALGDLVVTGPTRTNVNDFRAIYIE